MPVKPLALAFAGVLLTSASDVPTTYYVAYPQVEQVRCPGGYGTAFRAGGQWISVDHVTRLGGCFVGAMPAPARPEGNLDFTVIAPAKRHGLKINCEGFKKDEIYWAIGYAKGLPIQRAIRLIGTADSADNGMATLVGWPTVIPGMSGGPVINLEGEVVGTVNMYSKTLPISLSVELRGTSLCRNSASAVQ